MGKSERQGNEMVGSGLPLRGKYRGPPRAILASHLIFTGYGHWLSNDLRGSGSTEIRSDALKSLGEILPGRQFPQPAREEVRRFHREAEGLLEHPRIWFDEKIRFIIANAFGQAARVHGYTLWACAVCSNHAHVVPRTHRDRSEVIWDNLAKYAQVAVQRSGLVPENHPVWSHRPYKVFLYTQEDVVGRIGYVEDNPGKEGLERQWWEFVKKCPFDWR